MDDGQDAKPKLDESAVTHSLTGVVGACLTPFDGGGAINFDALAAEVEFMTSHVDAIAVGGVEASEYRLLTEQQRSDLIRIGIESVDRRVATVSGASAGTVSDVLRWIECGADAGAEYAQVLMPRNAWGGPLGPAELLDFFTAINAATPLPIVLYHNPSTGSDPDIGTLVELSRLDQVVAYKESSRDISKISRLIHEMDLAGHAAYLATMQPMLITLLLGGSGATMPPPGTLIAARIRDAAASGDVDGAIQWQRLFAFFPGVWGSHGLANVMKAASRHLGLDLGFSHHPVAKLPEEADRRLGEFLRGCGIVEGTPAGESELLRLARGTD